MRVRGVGKACNSLGKLMFPESQKCSHGTLRKHIVYWTFRVHFAKRSLNHKKSITFISIPRCPFPLFRKPYKRIRKALIWYTPIPGDVPWGIQRRLGRRRESCRPVRDARAGNKPHGNKTFPWIRHVLEYKPRILYTPVMHCSRDILPTHTVEQRVW